MARPRTYTQEAFAAVAHLSPQQQADALGCSLRTVQRHYAVLSRKLRSVTTTERSVRDVTPTVLDPASGSRMMYFDKGDPRVVFGDIRDESHVLSDGRALEIRPEVQLDFRALPYDDGAFRLVVFDPPHLVYAGERSWLARKYGKLHRDTWRDDLRRGFSECFRVLADGGTLVFKWSEVQVPVREVLELAGRSPVLGHPSGKRSGTHWILFLK